MMLTGAQIFVKVLLEQGVDTMFGYPGGVVLKLYDEIYKMKFPNILTGHEQGAVHAAGRGLARQGAARYGKDFKVQHERRTSWIGKKR